LAGTGYDWLRNPAAIEPKDRREFAELRKSELKTARAWAESLRWPVFSFTSSKDLLREQNSDE
jgi:hypothetical protein